jgi:endonuclease-3
VRTDGLGFREEPSSPIPAILPSQFEEGIDSGQIHWFSGSRAACDVIAAVRAAMPGTASLRSVVKRKRCKQPDLANAWAKRLARTRPNLVTDVLDGLASNYGRPVWRRYREPTSQLVLTILSQNSADTNAERAFASLRGTFPSTEPVESHEGDHGWVGLGLESGASPDWLAVEQAPLPELVEAIRAGGLAQQKAPRIQAALRLIRAERGDHALEFLGELPALEARDWLIRIDGVGRKTASVLLLFSFGMPLMPVDRHVERVGWRVGLIPAMAKADAAHEYYLALLKPDQMYEAHVNLITHGRQICHARNPECSHCPIALRCRYLDRKAP